MPALVDLAQIVGGFATGLAAIAVPIAWWTLRAQSITHRSSLFHQFILQIAENEHSLFDPPEDPDSIGRRDIIANIEYCRSRTGVLMAYFDSISTLGADAIRSGDLSAIWLFERFRQAGLNWLDYVEILLEAPSLRSGLRRSDAALDRRMRRERDSLFVPGLDYSEKPDGSDALMMGSHRAQLFSLRETLMDFINLSRRSRDIARRANLVRRHGLRDRQEFESDREIYGRNPSSRPTP